MLFSYLLRNINNNANKNIQKEDIKIFGYNFVKKNKNVCKIIIDNK